VFVTEMYSSVCALTSVRLVELLCVHLFLSPPSPECHLAIEGEPLVKTLVRIVKRGERLRIFRTFVRY